MIPLKEEPKVNAAFCFSDEDAQLLLSCQAAIAQAGNTVIASAQHENLLAHYTRSMLAEINRSSSAVAIRRMPKTNDSLLEALNAQIASLNLSALQAKRVVKTREIWLYELPGPAQSDLLQVAANMVRQFKAAGISIIVHSRQARPDSPHLHKLAERLRAKHVVFQTPDEEQCRKLAASAKGSSEAGQVNQLIRSFGITLESDETATLESMPANTDLADLMQRAGQKLPASNIDSAASNANQSAVRAKTAKAKTAKVMTGPATDRPAKAPMLPRSVSNLRMLVSCGIACLLVVGLYLSPSFDAYATLTQAVNWGQAQLHSAQTNSAEVPNTEAAASDVLAQAAAKVALALPGLNSENTNTAEQTPVQTQQDAAPRNTQAIADEAMILAQRPTTTESTAANTAPANRQANASEASLMTLFPVATPQSSPRPQPTLAFPPGVYVQHASFRLPQSALIWKNNNNQLPGVKVAAKGQRFVTVSGPFVDREQASQYLVEFGINASPYFISGQALRAQAPI